MAIIIIGKNSSIFKDIKDKLKYDKIYSHKEHPKFLKVIKKKDTIIYFGLDLKDKYEKSFDKKIIDISIIKDCRLIYFSSRKVYPKKTNFIFSEDINYSKSKNPYIRHKIFFEKYIIKNSNNYIILRLGTYLPSNGNSSKGSFNDLLKKNFFKKKIVFNFSIYSKKDFLFRDRMCECLNKLIKNGNIISGIYNLSSGYCFEISKVIKLLNYDKKRKLYLSNQNIFDSYLLINSKLNRALGAKYSLRDANKNLHSYLNKIATLNYSK